MERLQLLLRMWDRLNAETFHFMRALDLWIMFLLALLVVLMYISRQPNCADAAVAAAILGAIAPLWIGRADVLLHRPVPALLAVEQEINTILLADPTAAAAAKRDPVWKTWENHYKKNIRTGVKILVPFDAVALVFLLALFATANNDAAVYLKDTGWAVAFWRACWLVFLSGVGVIAFAKPLAE